MRKLASIQIINNIEKIPDADNIVKATVLGWDVVVKKDEFKVGDFCVFFEIDSILPEASWSEFMSSRNYRVKTCKLRKQLSQGLALPISILPENTQTSEDLDVTELLGIKKYEPQLHYGGPKLGMASGNFPPFIPKTDETRVQSCLKVLEELKGKPYYISLKYDGTSSTFYTKDDEFFACSRNFIKKEDDVNVYHYVARKYNLKEKLLKHPGLAIQGEIVGPSIQRNRLNLSDVQFFIFNVYDFNKNTYLDFDDFIKFCQDLELPHVEIIFSGDSFDFNKEDLLELAKGKYPGTNNNREGIVIRSLYESLKSDKLRGRMSFKVINNDFLLKDEE